MQMRAGERPYLSSSISMGGQVKVNLEGTHGEREREREKEREKKKDNK